MNRETHSKCPTGFIFQSCEGVVMRRITYCVLCFPKLGCSDDTYNYPSSGLNTRCPYVGIQVVHYQSDLSLVCRLFAPFGSMGGGGACTARTDVLRCYYNYYFYCCHYYYDLVKYTTTAASSRCLSE